MRVTHVPGRMKAKVRCLPVQGHGGSLIPGILDEITLANIVPKLPWKAFFVLSLVSPAWLHAIRSRQVYDARVHSQSLETLVLLNCGSFHGLNAIALYSVRDNVYHRLPPFPRALGFPNYRTCKCIGLDGKIYLLGGVYTTSSCEVYMAGSVYELDLAGQRQWKKCARMTSEREDFACGAMDGKIYVFQGSSSYRPLISSEFYDPSINAWSPLSTRPPMPRLRFCHQVATVGEELFLHDGLVFNPNYSSYLPDGAGEEDLTDFDYNLIGHPNAVEVYNPTKDDWREVQPLQRQFVGVLFTAHGKFYFMNHHGIEIYDTDSKSWANLHVHSFAAIEAVHPLVPIAVLSVDDELLAVVRRKRRYKWVGQTYFIRSKGLGGENEEIVWQKVQCSPPYPSWVEMSDGIEMCPIQL